MKPTLIMAGTVMLLALSACTDAQKSAADREQRMRAPPATAMGEPETCIATNRIRSTEAYDDYTIDFTMIDGTVYRNTLPQRCSGLGFENRFGYRTTINQLCSTDTITVLRVAVGPGPTCGLNEFVPVKLRARSD